MINYYLFKYIKYLYKLNFIIFLFISFSNLFFLFSFIKQNQLYLTYVNKFGFYLTNFILSFKINELNTSFILKIIVFFYFNSLIYYILYNFFKRNDLFKKVLYFFIHFHFFLISVFFYFFNYKNSSSKNLLINYFNFYIWLPEKWSLKNFFLKVNNNFYIFRLRFFINLKTFNIYYKNKEKIKTFFSNLLIKVFNYNLFQNFPILHDNIILSHSNYDKYLFLNLIFYYIRNNGKLVKFSLKTHLNNILFFKLINNKYLFKINKFINDNIINICLFNVLSKNFLYFNVFKNYIYDLNFKYFNYFNFFFNKNKKFISKNKKELHIYLYFKKIIENIYLNIIFLNIYLYRDINKKINIFLNNLLLKNIFKYNVNFLFKFTLIYFPYLNFFKFKLLIYYIYFFFKKGLNKVFIINDYNKIYLHKLYYLLINSKVCVNRFYCKINSIKNFHSSLLLLSKKQNNNLIYYLIILFIITLLFNLIKPFL